MFVRFRKATERLQVSLAETSRAAGKIQQEHVASLGAVADPPSVRDRFEFWRQLYERLTRLSNRLDTSTQAKILDEVHARVPMVTVEDIRALQLESAEADEKFWSGLCGLHQAKADDNRGLLATVQAAIATAEIEAASAATNADAAKERARKVRNGEAVAGGTSKPLIQDDLTRIMRDAGWTTQDIDHAGIVARIADLGGLDELMQEVQRRHRRAEYAAARTVLRRLEGAPGRPSRCCRRRG